VNDASKYRILVVDDEASVLLTYRLILEQQGYAVVACSTSREAIDAVEAQRFDVVLCDYSLEEQHTGFEVISAARKRDPETPAALLTGYATQETADEAERQNIGIMFKPIEIEEFLATTSNMLRRNHESNNPKGNGEKESRPQTSRKAREQRASETGRHSAGGFKD
jgi:DNA-binding NtrC family response regulator